MEEAAAGDLRVMYLSRGGELDGAQRQLLYLAREIGRPERARGRRYEPVVVLDERGPLYEELARAGIAVHVTPMRYWRRFPEALFRYVDARRLTGWARGQGVGLVHASDLWKSAYGLYVGRQLGVPCVVHVRGPLAARDVAKHGLARAAAVIAIARRYAEDLRGTLAPARIWEIDDSVDLQYFQRDAAGRQRVRAQWNVEGRVAVGLVGRLEPFKRAVEFLEAVGRLPEGLRQRATFLLIGQAGSPSYLDALRGAVARLKLGNCVEFIERRADMAAVLSALDLLATMAGGSVMFEAMACGTAVLSARADGRHATHTRHDQTAWCVNSHRPETVARELERVLVDEPLRLRLGAAGAAWAREHLSAAGMADKTAGVYETLVARASGASVG